MVQFCDNKRSSGYDKQCFYACIVPENSNLREVFCMSAEKQSLMEQMYENTFRDIKEGEVVKG
ncbi:MAG: hypothetical protein K8I00_04385, partial [Candidatus Omnitrophica bacterium]|nr:hypothetical protein [Candidatus Omnitrophota bacterium]